VKEWRLELYLNYYYALFVEYFMIVVVTCLRGNWRKIENFSHSIFCFLSSCDVVLCEQAAMDRLHISVRLYQAVTTVMFILILIVD
jgi:hypothetical protein